MDNQTDVVASRLEAARNELLDLGLRNNQLLNHRVLQARGVEVVDELPEEVFRILVREGRAMSFLPATNNSSPSGLGQPPLSPGRHTDFRLQTDLSSSDLQDRLLATYRLANTFIQEQGVNTLFLALGMVNWYESDAAQEARRAPLILIPVELERTNVIDRFRIRYSGEDIGGNLSLQAKAKGFDLSLPSLPETEDLSVMKYLDEIEKAIEPERRWSVDRRSVALGFFSFNRFLMYRDLDVDTWPTDQKPSAHPVLKALLDQGFNNPSLGISDDADLDHILAYQDVDHVVDVDSSQALALMAVGRGYDLVVQGPPGTGKSQTITNMIAEAMGNNKKVLFVSEKMAALDVVKRRLDVIGLGDACLELHSNKTAKTKVLNELHRTFSLDRPSLRHLVDPAADQLGSVRDRLNAYCNALREHIDDSGVNPYEALAELIRLRPEDGAAVLPDIEIPAIQSWTGADYRHKRGIVEELRVRIAAIGSPQDHAYWGVGRTLIFPHEINRLTRDLVAVQESLRAMIAANVALANCLGLPEPGDTSQAEVLCYSARLATEAPDLKGVRVRSEEWEGRYDDVTSLIAAGAEMTRLHEEYDKVLIPSAWEQEVLTISDVLVANGRKFLRILSPKYRAAKRNLAGLCSTTTPPGIDSQIQLVNDILAMQGRRAIFEQLQHWGESLFGEKWQAETSQWDVLAAIPEWVRRISGDIESGRALPGVIGFLEAGRPVTELQSSEASAATKRSIHVGLAEAIQGVLELDVAKRFGSNTSLAAQSFETQRNALHRWLARIDDIHDIASLNNLAKLCQEEGLDEVLTLSESWSRAGECLTDAFDQAWFGTLLTRAFTQRDALSTFVGTSHEQTQDRFQELDTLMLENNRTWKALNHWDQVPRSGVAGQVGVLLREFAKKSHHLSIRELMTEAGIAVQTIKPVMMMSPLSIANYLPAGKVHFDLVIFDEASQVKPVDAFGAILRGTQTVVVGDDEQLPPTNFFQTVAQGGPSPVSPTADIESLLGMFASKGAQKNTLRWHYRSRHESLIAFSNLKYYDNNLLIFPSPDADRKELGLQFHHLPDTVYDRGVSRTNLEEAKVVAQAVMDHARDYPDMTLGVAAFSMDQMVSISDQLELLRRGDTTLEHFFNSHPYEPFFVKNLETVQGDERDIIFISIGYGRQSNGQISMNFGPLSRDGGHRRLNVLVTRAKLRCEVFTNLTADDIDLSHAHSRGAKDLKSFLDYAQNGVFESPTQAGPDRDSPFQDTVASRLSHRGYDIQQEIGVAGYFIDLAVVDSDRPGRYILGIECDGATYHSSRYARDRDRLRQQVLKGLGWRIHRIWSTDWWRNPEKELQRTIGAIEDAKAYRPPTQQNKSNKLSVNRVGGSLQQSGNTLASVKYQVAKVTVQLSGLQLHQVPIKTMVAWIKEVVEVEGPIHTSEVVRRIAGVSRIVPRIQRSLSEAILYAHQSGEVRLKGEFIWSNNINQLKIRDRSDLPKSSKKLELVDPAEIALAIITVVNDAKAIKRSEIPKPVVRLLGFTQISRGMRSRVDSQVERLIVEKKLIEQGGFLVVPN